MNIENASKSLLYNSTQHKNKELLEPNVLKDLKGTR